MALVRRPVSLRALGGLALASWLAHAIEIVWRSSPWDFFWACNVAPVLIGLGCVVPNAHLLAIGALWLSWGTPMWIVDLATGGTFWPTSLLNHFGCLAVAALAMRRLGLPRGSWWRATVALTALMLLCRFVTPAALNINLSHAVWAGWERYFESYNLYHLLLTLLGAAVFFVAERLWRGLWIKDRGLAEAT
jgi:hypothetical protein